MTEILNWNLNEWTAASKTAASMSSYEIYDAIKYLRKNRYPKPEDCLGTKCPGYRSACRLNICYVAIQLCGNF